MGARGPVPYPTKVLETLGSWKAKERIGEVQFEPGIPTCPEFLKGEARKEWTRQSKQLDDAGIMQKTDRAALAMYCQAWAEYCEINDYLSKLEVEIRVNSRFLLKARHQAAGMVIRLGARFGFTPSDRTRIHAGGGAATEVDPLEVLLMNKEKDSA